MVKMTYAVGNVIFMILEARNKPGSATVDSCFVLLGTFFTGMFFVRRGVRNLTYIRQGDVMT